MRQKHSAAIIGPGRIGKVYLRELIKLKYSEIFLFGGKKKPDFNKIDFIKNLVKKKILKIKYYKNLNEKIKECSVVCICSPSNTHLKYIKLLENTKVKIIVEKPLISLEDLNKINISKFLFQNILKKRKVLCSYPVRFYAKEIKKIIKTKKIKYIKFKYHTTGKNTYEHIPEDLLPHAISFIFEFFKKKVNNLSKFKKNQFKNKWNCTFQIEKTNIIFDFKQNIKAKESKLEIFLNDFKISRYTKSLSNSDLDVFLKINNKKHKIKNPMSENIIYNHNRLIKHKKLLFDYNINYNIILLIKRFIEDEK